MGGFWHWFLYDFTGAGNEGGVVYGLWSGAGGDIGNFALLGGFIALYRKHTCHVRHCWRLQRHAVEGTAHIVCRKHHPLEAVRSGVTAEAVAADHRAANA